MPKKKPQRSDMREPPEPSWLIFMMHALSRKFSGCFGRLCETNCCFTFWQNFSFYIKPPQDSQAEYGPAQQGMIFTTCQSPFWHVRIPPSAKKGQGCAVPAVVQISCHCFRESLPGTICHLKRFLPLQDITGLTQMLAPVLHTIPTMIPKAWPTPTPTIRPNQRSGG